MPQDNKHQRALELVANNHLEESAKLLAQALAEDENAELWNDWATVKVALDETREALAGYERALELDPQHAQAACNLGLLLTSQGRISRGLPLLRQSAAKVGVDERAAAESLLAANKNQADADFRVAAILDKFAPQSGPALEYFSTHRERYLNCLELLPAGQPSQKLLLLGASFHCLAPALEEKGYSVRCADKWDGETERITELTTADGSERRKYVVDNFDLQQQRWPYKDGEFNVAVLPELLERLNQDPMAAPAEINRVLKSDGLLLLATHNKTHAKSVSQVESLLQAAGFDVATLETRNSRVQDQTSVLARLVAEGQPIVHRGENIFALARKSGAVKDRYPQEFYGSKSSTASSENQIAGKTKNILVIHDVLPHFDKSGADVRLLQIVQRLRAQGHAVTYIGRNGANEDKYGPMLRELGVAFFAGDSERLRALCFESSSTWKFEDVLHQGHFDAAILYHWFWSALSVAEQYIDDIRKHSPATRILVLSDDRHGIREWRAAEISKLSADYERALNFLVREAECYRSADLILGITEEDRQGLIEMVPELRVELVPMLAETHESKAGFDDRADFVFLANFDNLANCDATTWFCAEIWPRVRKRLPAARLYLAGNNIPKEFSKKPGIEVLGYVADLAATLDRFRVFISPIRVGTGIKTKNLMAMGNGIPLVTTTIGAEGIRLTDGENAMIGDTAGDFANKAVELYKDPVLWRKLAENGRKHIAMEFSVERLDSRLKEVLTLALETVPQPYDPEHRFSARLVEELHPEVLTATDPRARQELRVFGYLEMAEKLAGMGRPKEAMEQARHIFWYLRGAVSRSLFLARILTLMERCYRETGDLEAAKRCGQEAKLCMPELNPAALKQNAKKTGPRIRPSDHAISVIIPTFNRREKLARCLEALSKQTLAADEFEVIVVDDGSSDDTQAFLREQRTAFRLSSFHQANQGAGAARRLGVDNARGEYLLLINDDTIAQPDLLQEHLLMQRKYHASCFAVLGTFEYERQARRRALTHFLSVDPFMFPQLAMRPGFYYGHTHFITCNLSVRRDAVLAVGSFDPAFRLGEDTELGLRLAASGSKVLFHPKARAIHDHLEMTIDDLVRRARAYGPVYLQLLRKHTFLRITHSGMDLSWPLTTADIESLRERLSGQQAEIVEMVKALKQYDNRDFEPAFARRSGEGPASDMIVSLFRQAIPQLHWFYVFEGLCEAWATEVIVAPAELATAGARV